MINVHPHLITLYFAVFGYYLSVFGDFAPVLHQFVHYFLMVCWVHGVEEVASPF